MQRPSVALVEKLIDRDFQGSRILFERLDGGDGVPILDTRCVAAEQARPFLDIALRQMFCFAELSEAFADDHRVPYPTQGRAYNQQDSGEIETNVSQWAGVHSLRPKRKCESFRRRRIKRVEVIVKAVIFIVTFAFLCSGSVLAQSQESSEKEAAIVELGAAASWSMTDRVSSFGPNTAVEFTPIENWLEIKAGVGPLFRLHSTEWDADVLFKKPWTLSRKAEFMFGVGPEWVHTNAFGLKTNSVAGEAAGDFMFWPAKRHKFGWYLEPAYDYNFGHGHEQSVGITGGLLIVIP